MASFFTRKKVPKSAAGLVIDGAASTLPSITASPPPSASPQSPAQPMSPNSPISPMPPLDSPAAMPELSVKKTKKKGLLSKLFKSSSSKSPKSPSSPQPQSQSSGGMLGIFRRKGKKKAIVKNERGEEEEREISVSLTVSRIPRNTDDDEDGLGGNDTDDILIYPIFGVPLIKLLEVKQAQLSPSPSSSQSQTNMLALPKQIIDVCEFIRFSGLKSEGLFRVSGESGSIREMKEKLDRGEELELTSQQLNINDLTGLFKLYWRSLPEPLFPYHFYDGLLTAVDEKNWPGIQSLIQEFPEPNRTIIDYLVHFLGEVALYGSENRMTPMNLAVCFAPNLMRMREEKVERVMIDAPKVIAVIQRLIEIKRQLIVDERQKEEEEEKIKLEAEERARQQKIQMRLLHQQQAQQQAISEQQAAIEAEIERQKQIEIQQSIENEIEAQLQQEREQREREAAARAKAKAHAEAQIAKAAELKRKMMAPNSLTATPDPAAARVCASSDGEAFDKGDNHYQLVVPAFLAVENNEQFQIHQQLSSRTGSTSILPPVDSSPLPVLILMPTQTTNITSVDERRPWSQASVQQSRAINDFAMKPSFCVTVTSVDGAVSSPDTPVKQLTDRRISDEADTEATVVDEGNQYVYSTGDDEDDEEAGVLVIHHRSPSNSVISLADHDRIDSNSDIQNTNVEEVSEDDLIEMMSGMSISTAASTQHPSASSTSSLPMWAQRQEERKRLDEIAKLEASLRERVTQAGEQRQRDEHERRERMEQEKAAAKSKLPSVQQSPPLRAINSGENRSELEIVAERVTTGAGATTGAVPAAKPDEFAFWSEMY